MASISLAGDGRIDALRGSDGVFRRTSCRGNRKCRKYTGSPIRRIRSGAADSSSPRCPDSVCGVLFLSRLHRRTVPHHRAMEDGARSTRSPRLETRNPETQWSEIRHGSHYHEQNLLGTSRSAIWNSAVLSRSRSYIRSIQWFVSVYTPDDFLPQSLEKGRETLLDRNRTSPPSRHTWRRYPFDIHSRRCISCRRHSSAFDATAPLNLHGVRSDNGDGRNDNRSLHDLRGNGTEGQHSCRPGKPADFRRPVNPQRCKDLRGLRWSCSDPEQLCSTVNRCRCWHHRTARRGQDGVVEARSRAIQRPLRGRVDDRARQPAGRVRVSHVGLPHNLSQGDR